MDRNKNTTDEWHTDPTHVGVSSEGVARYGGTRRIREWGPLLSSISRRRPV